MRMDQPPSEPKQPIDSKHQSINNQLTLESFDNPYTIEQRNANGNGYVLVGTRTKAFYDFAVYCCESIKDYYPDAKVAIFTEERYITDYGRSVSDYMFTTDELGPERLQYRAKLWGMAMTPFAKTFYIDCDSEIVHEDIATVFNQLESLNVDMAFTSLTQKNEYAFVGRTYGVVEYWLCGGVCLYDSSNPLIIDFLFNWHRLYNMHYNNGWWPVNENGYWDTKNFPRELKFWDQFSLWWLTEREDKYKKIRIGILEGDERWNYFNRYQRNITVVDQPVVLHYSAGVNKEKDI